MNIEQLTKEVIDAMFEVHKELGPGLLESSYEVCLCHELSLRGIKFERQVGQPITDKGLKLETGYRIDILVDDTLVLELKAVDELQGIHKAQLITYLKLSGRTLGLLANFNTQLLKDGLKRVVYNHPNSPPL